MIQIPQAYTITFLGTAGARVMVASQLLASGGIWLELGNTRIMLDPGPGALVQASKRKLQPDKLDAVILSHRHLDHSGDANVMVEAMTQGGFKKGGTFFAPADALGAEPALYSYLRGFLDSVQLLEEGKTYTAGEVSFNTPIRHIHAVETYGIVFQAGGHTFSYIADTRFFEGLCQSYKGELLIMNVLRLKADRPLDHLSVPDAAHIIAAIKPKAAIMTHFGRTMWAAHPWEIAEKMTEATGIKVIAARDGMRFDLETLEVINARQAR